MATTKIEWTRGPDGSPGASWNPIRAIDRATGKSGWYCEHATPGCEHCYSEALNRRLGTRVDYARQNRDRVELYLDERILEAPLAWRDPRRVFVCSMTDLFAEFVPDEWLDKICAIMKLCRQHTFQVLTKRAERMRGYMNDRTVARSDSRGAALHNLRPDEPLEGPWPLPNVWLIVSVEDQRRADERIPELLATPAAVRGISAEPLLGPVSLDEWLDDSRLGQDRLRYQDAPARGLDWVLVGGESGSGARPMHPDWARSLRNQCIAAGVPFFFKQWGEFAPVGYPDGVADPVEHLWIRVGKKAAGRELDGRTWDEYPREERA